MEYLEQLKALKDKRNLTYAEIAEISDVPLTTVTRIFSGATPNPTFETIARITLALGGSLDSIAGVAPNKDKPTASTVVEQTISSYAELLKDKDERIMDLKEEVKEVRREKHRFAITLACVFVLMLIVIIVDILSSDIGFFRY